MEYPVKIHSINPLSKNVKSFIVEKPKGYTFIPGQSTDVAINRGGMQTRKRAFTFSSLNDDAFLEFIIKGYPDGLTEELHNLKSGDELIIEKPFGMLTYKEKGVFIAGGTGVTPFVAISRYLTKMGKNENALIFSNKTSNDLFLESELRKLFGKNLILNLTQEKHPNYESKRIDKKFLKERIKNFDQHFYICGPAFFVKDIKKSLEELGAKNIVIER